MKNNNMAKKKKTNTKSKVLIGTGLALAAAAGYLFSTTKPATRKKFVTDVTKKVKAEVSKRFGQAKSKSQAGYQKVVSEVLREYQGVKNIDAQEFSKIGQELKSHWRSIAESFKEGRKPSK
jgi:hypothetical protein